ASLSRPFAWHLCRLSPPLAILLLPRALPLFAPRAPPSCPPLAAHPLLLLRPSMLLAIGCTDSRVVLHAALARVGCLLRRAARRLPYPIRPDITPPYRRPPTIVLLAPALAAPQVVRLRQ